jgi:hypothetical protein
VKLAKYPQFGFASSSFGRSDVHDNNGVGDDAHSWSVDGKRRLLWTNGKRPWSVSWAEGDVVGLAANPDCGKIAVSLNGEWTGVVFNDAHIRGGVYPAFSCDAPGKVRYRLQPPFRFAPPEATIWA